MVDGMGSIQISGAAHFWLQAGLTVIELETIPLRQKNRYDHSRIGFFDD